MKTDSQSNEGGRQVGRTGRGESIEGKEDGFWEGGREGWKEGERAERRGMMRV